ncbi:MAG: alpha-2-macroglobulin family protein [Calditrichaeota bacterium]|nr:alpha-2-macroglobulin family protein [Calditrichota bacterium]
MIKNLFNFFLFIFMTGLFFQCENKQEVTPSAEFDLETAKIISHLPAGVLEPESAIKIRFVNNQIDKEQVSDTEVNQDALQINPSLPGRLSWENEQTLVFKPSSEMPSHTLFEATLFLDELFADKYKNAKPVSFSFRIAGQELTDLKGDFELVNAGSPKQVFYKGNLSFSLSVDSNKLQQALEMTSGNKELKINLMPTGQNNQFEFRTENIDRTSSAQSFVLSLDAAELNLPSDVKYDVELPGLKDLQVTDIRKDESGGQPRIRISLSDELDENQDINGFLSITPEIKFSVKKMERALLVSAPFEYGKAYTFELHKGLRSRWATDLKDNFKEKITFEDLLPEIKFDRDGIILTSANQQKISFLTVNVRKVHLSVMKVFESNLGQFLQTSQLDGNANRNDNFSYDIHRVGVTVVDTALEIGAVENRWLQSEIDLSKIIKPDMKGLLLLSLRFEKEDMIYNQNNNQEYANYRNNRNNPYGEPGSYWYLYNKGQVFKPIILSDIGLTFKQLDGKAVVYATNLIDAKPLEKVMIRLRTYQNQAIAERVTNSSGMASFDQLDESVFYIEAEYAGQRSVIKVNEMAWNLSAFDINGRSRQKGGINAFTYTDRGVYRPGDTVNVSIIVRDNENSFPENHPVTMEVFNPLGQLLTRIIQNKAKDGFYNFSFSTQEQDPTGSYRADFKAGSAHFSEVIRIETIVPERLKIAVQADPEKLLPGQRNVNLNVQANYLFGSPASNLETTVDVNVRKMPMHFKNYEDYIFENEQVNFQPVDNQIVRKTLDVNGQLFTQWTTPDFSRSASRLRAHFEVKVFEKGGRFTKQDAIIQIEPFKNYVGVQRPNVKWGYAQTGIEYNIPVILLDTNGNPVPGKTLRYTIYRNESNWWWEYSSRDQFRMRYKSDVNTIKISEGNIFSAIKPVSFTFIPEDRGEYLIEVQDESNNGHSASFFINAYPWGQAPAENKDAGNLALRSDKEKYTPGEEADISFPVPDKGSVLVSIEKGEQILSSNWYNLPADNNEMHIPIKITDKMLPTAYASVSVIQPHSATENDRPIRTYGVVPLNVYKAETALPIKIIMPDELETAKPFDVQIQTADKSKAQFTIAVVDEGLLQLTRFKTPNAWDYFYSKERLGVLTYDLFGNVIGANRGDIFRTFSIGGGLDAMEMMADNDQQDRSAKRFKAVSMFEGPIFTDNNGYAKVRFNMPEYIGAVRVMAIAANKQRYGSTEKRVAVKSDLMVLPTLPRVLGPEDIIDIPVTVFAMKDNLGDVKITLKSSGPLEIIGTSEKQLSFSRQEDKDIAFRVKALAAVGIASIQIDAKSASSEAHYKTELEIRTSAGEEFISIEKAVVPGQQVSLHVPDDGIKGSNKAVLSVRRFRDLNFKKRLYQLIRFPYGCVEQTVSAVFPQLYLERFVPSSSLAKQDIDHNINSAIKRLRKFSLPSGAFSYWPGNRDASDWGTNYAGHFLLEARKQGYHVPDDLIADWVHFQQSQARLATGDLMVRVYRLYVLALSGNPAMGPMNLIRESSLPALNDTERWLLAAAYQLAGIQAEANMILKETGTDVKSYREFAHTYGSDNRDKALILDQMTLFKEYNKAQKIVEDLSLLIKSDSWLSTQESAFILLALAKYMEATTGTAEAEISGSVILSDGKNIPFKTRDSFDLEITSFGTDLKVHLDKNDKIKQAYALLDWQGIPLKSVQPDFEKGVELQVQWLDENGQVINPVSLVQGQSIWGRFSVKVKNERTHVEELALTQILPAGWEIENLRLGQNDLPAWTRSFHFKKAEFEDIRDDRISWFFDLSGYEKQKDFLVKINAVTVGEFLMPGATFMAMYDNDYRATKAGKTVKVLAR